MKYVNTQIVFQEIPNEVSLAINISNCPCKCLNCHSSYLAEDIGEELNIESLSNLISKNKGITCICFMGGDAQPEYLNKLAISIKIRSDFPYKVAWYSGREEISDKVDLALFDYIKIGPYKEEFGPLNSKTTNQKFYKINHNNIDDTSILEDCTYLFQKEKF